MGLSSGLGGVVLKGRVTWPGKAIRIVLALLSSLLLCIAVAAAMVLYSQTGSRWAIHRAAEWYSDAIPGEVTVGNVTGALAFHVTLRDLAFKDAAGDVLIGADVATVAWSPSRLLTDGIVSATDVAVHNVVLNLYDKGAHNPFLDLALPGPSSPSLGPDLPVPFELQVRVKDFTLTRFTSDKEARCLVEKVYLAGRLTAEGRQAGLSVSRASGFLPAEQLAIGSLSFDAFWDEPSTGLRNLEVQSNWGSAAIDELTFDVAQLDGRAHVDAVMAAPFIETWLAFRPEKDIQMALDITGDPNSFWAGGSLKGLGNAELTVRLMGSMAPTVDLKGTVDILNLSPGPLAGLKTEVASGKGTFSITGKNLPTSRIAAELNCGKCRLGALGVADAAIKGVVENGAGQLQAAVSAAGIHVEGATEVVGWQIGAVTWRASSANLLTATSALEKVTGVPAIRGTLHGNGVCERIDATLRCNGTLLGTGIKTPWMTCRRLKWEFAGEPTNPLLPFESSLAVSHVRVKKELLGDIEIAAKGNKDRIEARVKGRRRGRDRLRAHLAVTTTWPLAVELMDLEAAYRSLNIRLRHASCVEIDNSRLSIEKLSLEVADGRVILNGILSASGASHLDVEVSRLGLSHLALMFPRGDIGGVLNGKGLVRGTPNRLTAEVELGIERLVTNGQVIGDVRIKGTYKPSTFYGTLAIDNGIADDLLASASVGMIIDGKAGTVRVLKEAPYDIRLEMKGLRLAELSSFFTDMELAGRLNLEGRFQRNKETPELTVKADANGLKWGSFPIGDAAVALRSEHRQTDVDIQVTGALFTSVHVKGSVPVAVGWDDIPKWRYEEVHSLEVAARDVSLDSLAEAARHLPGGLGIPPIHLGGRLNLEASFGGTLRHPKLDTYVDIKAMTWDSKRVGDMAIAIDSDAASSNLHAQVVRSENRYADIKASVPMTVDLVRGDWSWDPRQPHSLSLLFNGLDNALLKPFFVAPSGLDFRINGTLSGKGRLGAFALNGKCQAMVSYLGSSEAPVIAALRANEVAQKLHVTVGLSKKPSVSLEVETHLSESLFQAGPPDLTHIPFHADLEIFKLGLSRFSGMLPRLLFDMKGQLSGRATAGGTLENPKVGGRLTVSKGEVTIAPLNQRIKDIELTAEMSGSTAIVKRLRFRSGHGHGRGSFRASFDQLKKIAGTGNLTLTHFPVVTPGIPEGLVSAKVAAKFAHTADNTTIEFETHHTRLRIIDTSLSRSPKALPRSVGIEMTVKKRASSKNAGRPAPTLGLNESQRRIRISLSMKDPVVVHGQGIDMRWTGGLSLLMVGDAGTVSGGIRSLPGRFLLLGNNFDIDSGEIVFTKTENADPFVDIIARTRTSEAEITALIRGRASHPDLVLRSDPPLTQYQIVSLLLTGKSDTTDRDDNESNVQAQAASLLLSFNNSEIERKIYETLGIDRASVAIGQTVEEPIVTVGKRVGKKFYIETEYHHNAPQGENVGEGTVEYRFTPHWSLETSYGDAQKGEIGIYWQKRFDAPKGSDKRVR